MLHMSPVSLTPHDMCHKELDFADDLVKPSAWEARGRTFSDDLSTAAPSPEASPLFGPQASTPLCGPEDLLLPELSSFELPEAQDCFSGSDAEFELAGFDDDDDEETCMRPELAVKGLNESEDEDVESQLISLLGDLASLRAEKRRHLQEHESGDSLQKIPYPQLESGFLPAQFMPMQSWLIPSGRAQTGQWAYAMAPRPANSCMEPLNIVLGEGGISLEVATSTNEYAGEIEKRRVSKAKAVFRRRAGRSRSPMIALDEMKERGASPRGRRRVRTH